MQDEAQVDPWAFGNQSTSTSSPNPNPTSTLTSSSTLTSRHPLNRTPSPSTKSPGSTPAAGMARRRAAAAAAAASSSSSSSSSSEPRSTQAQPESEWSTLGAGIASIFGSGSHHSSYQSQNGRDGWQGSGRVVSSGEAAGRSRVGLDDQSIQESRQEERERNKGHLNPLSSNASALDKLEGWFGITPDPQSQSLSSNQPSSSRPSTSSQPSTSTSKTRLVHVHQVSPSDTLSSIALLYGSDVPSLRRANRLWPGDSAQMRSQIYILVDQCKFIPPSQTESDDPESLLEEDWRENASINGRESQANRDDAASDFLPDTNKAYSEPNSHALRNGNDPVSGLVVGYPASLNPSQRAASSTSSSLTPISSSQPRRGASSSSTSLLPRSSYASSSGSAAESSSAAAARQKAQRSQPTRVPSEALSFFPPASSPAIDKGKKRMENLSSTESDLGARDLDPGASGLDDLLRARDLEREREFANSGRSEKSRASLDSSNSFSVLSHGSEAQTGEDSSEWKPNKWTFGKGGSVRRQTRANGSEANQDSNLETNPTSKSNLKPLHLLERSSSSNGGPSLASVPPPSHQGKLQSQSHPPPPPSTFSAYASDIASIARSSTGWNDAPPPDSKVSHAYSGKGSGKKKNHHRILNDLAAGLPPNSGPAQNWARPIAGSLPLPPSPPSSTSMSASNAPPPRPVLNSDPTSSVGAKSGVAWGKLLNDTLRGRIHLDDALTAATSQFNSPSPSSSSNQSHPTTRNKHISNLDEPPQRLSADLARVTLGRSSNREGDPSESIAYAWSKEGEYEASSSSTTSNRNGIETAHRLERMDSKNQLKESASKGVALNGTERHASVIGSAAGRRRGGNVRQIDWTSEAP